MPRCSQCGRNVNKLVHHLYKKEKVCYRCMTESGCYAPDSFDRIEIFPNERREHIRIPISIECAFELEGNAVREKKTYHAHTVDISLSGLCFAWENCTHCKGYKGGSVYPDCIFYPYSSEIGAGKGRDLIIRLALGKKYSLELPCNVVYTFKEEEMDLEYVGLVFTRLGIEKRAMLELVLHKYHELD